MKCDAITETFVKCTNEHFLSVIWKCRDQMNSMNECLKQYTTDETLEQFKQRWVKAGMPSDARHDLWPEEKHEWQAFIKRREDREGPQGLMERQKKQFYNA